MPDADKVDADAPLKFFRWWGNSCHMHSFLEVSFVVVLYSLIINRFFQCVVFAILDQGISLFDDHALGKYLIEFYKLSRTMCSRRNISVAFRACFHGICDADIGSVKVGIGRAEFFDSVISSVFKVFDNYDNSMDFVSRKKTQRQLKMDLVCSCGKSFRCNEERVSSCVVIFSGFCVSDALEKRETFDFVCPHCKQDCTTQYIAGEVIVTPEIIPDVLFFDFEDNALPSEFKHQPFFDYHWRYRRDFRTRIFIKGTLHQIWYFEAIWLFERRSLAL